MLAAGLGRRFGEGGAKLWALWRGQPLIEHVLSTLSLARTERLIGGGVLVYGPSGSRLRDLAVAFEFDAVLASRADRGLSESLKAGFATLEPIADDDVAAALICLGDQPALSLGTIRALTAVCRSPDALARPRYADQPESPGHPVVIGRHHWRLVDETAGDKGLDPILAAHDLRWTTVPVPGANPDIDTPGDIVE